MDSAATDSKVLTPAHRRIDQLSRSPWGRRLLWLASREAECATRSAHASAAARENRLSSVVPDCEDHLSENDRTQADRLWRAFAGSVLIVTALICVYEVLWGSNTAASPVPPAALVMALLGAPAALACLAISRQYRRLNRAVDAQVECTHTTCDLTAYFDAVQNKTLYADLPSDEGVEQLRADIRSCAIPTAQAAGPVR